VTQTDQTAGKLPAALAPQQATSTGPASLVAIAAAGLLAYVALEWLSFIHEFRGVPITPWNPGLGVVFALMLLFGARYGAVLFAGVIIAEIVVLQSGLAWPIIIGIAAIIAVGYGATAAVVRHTLRIDVGLNHLRDVFVLLAAGAGGAIIVALFLSMLLIADTQLDADNILIASVPLLVGDAIGIAVVTPLVLRLASRSPRLSLHALRSLGPEVALYVTVVMASLWIILGTESESGFKYFYLLFLPVVVAAVRHGLDGACFGLALTQLGLVALLHRHGYDANVFTEFQILMLVLTATGLTVGVTITERRQAAARVRAVEQRLKANEAEAARAARHNLVSSMASALAHEINQPMTAARALARSVQHILHAPDLDRPRADNNLTTLVEQIDHASGVIRRMREFLRRGRPHVSSIDLRGMLEDALTLVRADASAHGIRIELDIPPALPMVHGDRIQLQQVALNLIRNAIEAICGAGRKAGSIRIAAWQADEPRRIEISVVDDGPGVDPDLAGRLFEPLTTSKSEGLGLGLAICASILDSHGGRIWLQAHAAGATEFRLSLPLDPARKG
jgi:signal transduction histidine kinase